MAETTPVPCPAVLDIAAVQDFYVQLRDALDNGEALTLQCAQLERIDTAGVQLLVACCRDATDRNLPIHWDGVNDILYEAAKRLGLLGLLHLDHPTTF